MDQELIRELETKGFRKVLISKKPVDKAEMGRFETAVYRFGYEQWQLMNAGRVTVYRARYNIQVFVMRIDADRDLTVEQCDHLIALGRRAARIK